MKVPRPRFVYKHPLCLTCVGVMWLMSSDANCLRSVVFPPLSRPSSSILTSWSGVLFSLRRMDSNPYNKQLKTAAWCYCSGGTGGALLQLTTIAKTHLFFPSTNRPFLAPSMDFDDVQTLV